ncbi:MAG TPA: hypothetical protein VGU66_18540 [Candidatus Elarobacter sp.]|nr:hypothetical protein [Candidatus Elarobacter sp.]
MSNERVTDETILEGFRSLAQAMAEGFDRQRADLTAVITAEIRALRSEMNQRFAESEQRMLRHFDKRDDRLDNHERRITILEANR